MKKIITLTLALILALSLAACEFSIGGGDNSGDPATSKPPGTSQPSDTSKPTDPLDKLSLWTGTWVGSQDWPNINLTQNGNSVTGSYGSTQSGVIEGTVSGNILSGKWTNSGRTGMFQFTMLDGGNRFEIEWTNDTTTNWIDATQIASRVDSNAEMSLIGMWRSPYSSSLNGPMRGVVFFEEDGTYLDILFRQNNLTVSKGKYTYSGNTLSVYDRVFFEKHDNALLFEYMLETWRELWGIIDYGTRSEVMELANIESTHYRHYRNQLQAGYSWVEGNSWSELVTWIDNSTIDYVNGLGSPLYKIAE